MNGFKNKREGSVVAQMIPRSLISAPGRYQSVPVSRSVILSSYLHSRKQFHFLSESEPQWTAEEHPPLNGEDGADGLLENSQLIINSNIQTFRVCKYGHKTLEVSSPFLGYLPEFEEEIRMSFPYMQDGSGVSPPGQEFYSAYSQSILRKGRGMPENNFEFIFSDTSSMGIRSSVGVPYSSTTTEEDFQELEQESSVDSSPTRFILQRKPRKGRKMLLYTPGSFCGYDPEKFGICNRSVSFLNPVQALRKLQHEGMHSPGINVHFRSTQRLHAPSIIRSKPAISHAGSELPLSSPMSAPSDEIEHPQIKVGLYKTELCRSWEETGHCRYAAKCQFAHGNDDLRPVPRHPKYKTEVISNWMFSRSSNLMTWSKILTEDRTSWASRRAKYDLTKLCRSYTETGLCSYGKRCRFIHTSGTNTQAFLESRDLEKKGSRRLSIFQQLSGAGEMPPRQA